MTATVRKHPERPGVWCVIVTAEGSCRERILSTHATRDGAAVSANQINRADRDES